MWKKIRTKYLQTLFAAGIAGIWGVLMGKDDWTSLLVDSKTQITIIVYAALIFFGVITFLVTTIQNRRSENEIFNRSRGETKDN